MPSILLVDDHPLFRDGFAHMVRMIRPDWRLHLADGAAEARSAFAALRPDLLIIDVGLPGEDGFTLFQEIGQRSPETAQILISGRDDAAIRIRARACGARSFIAKTAPPETIAKTIDAVLEGRAVFETDGDDDLLPALTQRQIEVLMLLAEGHSNKEIRHRLNIAERTVRAHLTDVFNLLKANSRMQAVVRARELGLIS